MIDNGKKVLIAITEGMVKAGIEVLEEMTAEGTEEATDIALVTSIFIRMWQVHHKEIDAIQQAKVPRNVLAVPEKREIIIPGVMPKFNPRPH